MSLAGQKIERANWLARYRIGATETECADDASRERSLQWKHGYRSTRWLTVTSSLALMFAITGCRDFGEDNAIVEPSQQIPLTLTDKNFHQQVVESDLPVLVDMWAPWCQPCIEMKPTIHLLTNELHGEVKVGELNVEDNPFITEKYGVDRYPMMLVFVHGQEVARLIGPQKKQTLLETIRRHIDEERIR